MKGRGVIFKLGDRCIVFAKDDKKTEAVKTKPADNGNADPAIAAINAVLMQAIRQPSEYYKCEDAKKIYKIAKKSSSPKVRAHAINALSKVSGNMTSAYYATTVSEYITELA